jgi:hypothetical protein
VIGKDHVSSNTGLKGHTRTMHDRRTAVEEHPPTDEKSGRAINMENARNPLSPICGRTATATTAAHSHVCST